MSARFLKKPVLRFANNHLINYPTPLNIHYAWNFGFVASVFLLMQVVTGVFLAMHYVPHIDLAFVSVEGIMRDVQAGWALRYTHANGASFFFIAVYVHILRGLYFGSYVKPKQGVWVVGVVIFLLMILTAFLGYILPWGQMSLWGATVITSLATAIPVIGYELVLWVWGDFSVANATLNRFYSLHFLLPFVILGLVFVHLAFLHATGSNNPLGLTTAVETVPIYPYFILKDFVGVVFFLAVFFGFVFYWPNSLNHPDNYINANPLVTPHLILPEWYFLIFYAILRSIPHKLGGVVAMLCSIAVLLLLPWLHSAEVRSSRFRPLYKGLYWLFVSCCLILGWVGSQPVEEPYVLVGQVATLYYFFYLLVGMPLLAFGEQVICDAVKSET